MHYIDYCKNLGMHQGPPPAADNLYHGLNRIGMNRRTVLLDIEQMPVRVSKLGDAVQRCLDILVSCFGILVGAIPSLVIAIAIKIDSPGPVFYAQKRVGKKGKVFQMIKFRTMCENAESGTGPVWALKEDPRVTRVGTVLRKLRLDEVPQLFNILKGDMTLVGPRPERPELVYQFTQYMPAFDRRHDVKPGIAGIAQMMNGYDSSSQSVYRKLRWDSLYIRKRCLTVDFCVLYRTILAVLKGKV